MIAAQNVADFSSAVATILGVGAILGGAGYAIGQFFSSRRKGISDSLATALNEIQVERSRGDRVEEELARQGEEFALLKAENVTLRSLVTSGANGSAKEINAHIDRIADLIRAEHEKTRAFIADVHGGGPK